MSLGILLLVGNAFWGAVPKADAEQKLVEKWLKENTEDGKWEVVKWFPAVTIQGLYDANLRHVIENTEKVKNAYEKGIGKENHKADCQKLYDKVRETGLRTFCGMKYRVTTLNGQAMTLRRQVFEIVEGSAIPCLSNEIMELPSFPSSQPSQAFRTSYDGWRFFEESEYNPFPVDQSQNLEARFQAAMVWGEPTPAPITTVEQSPQQIQHQIKPAFVAATFPVMNQRPEANATVGIPLKIREYFDRATEVRSSEVKKLEKRITTFQSKLRTAKDPDKERAINERIRQTEDEIAELKRSNNPPFLPDKPEVGDIGLFQELEVMEAIDEKTLIVRWLPNGKGRLPKVDVVIHPIEASEHQVGDVAVNAVFFRIVETKHEPLDVMKNMKEARKVAEYVAEPFNKAEIDKWRAQYEKETKKK